MVVKLSDFLNTSFSTYTENDAFNTSVVYPITLTHTTTDTPGNGIGTGLKFITETSAGNNEIGGLIEVVTTDVTSGSEDFDFVFKTMAGGNAATESLRIGSTGDLTTAGDLIVNGGQITLTATSTRDKYRVWTSSDYTIGMQNSVTFGAINNDYAMTFQMSNTANRGFWWGDTAHTVAQGAMALSTDGKLSVAHSLRLGYGESDTTTPGIDFVLDVNGSISATNIDFGNVDIGTTTGFDSWKYDGNSFDLSNETVDPRGIFVDSTGGRAYIAGFDLPTVYHYNFQTVNKIDTLLYSEELDTSSEDTQITAVFLKPNGTELYVTGLDNTSVYQYTLGTAFSLASATYTGLLSVSAIDTIPVGLFFKSDGTKMYLVGQQNADVYQYNLSTAWDITSASYLQTLSLASYAKTPTAISFSDNGSILYIADSKYDSILKFTLSTAWDISTAAYTDKVDISDASGTGLTNPTGIALSETANRLFIVCANNDKAFELDLISPSARVSGNRLIVNNDAHIKNDLVVYQDARIHKNVEILGTTALHDNLTVTGTVGITGATTITGNLAVNSSNLTSTQTTFNLLNTGVTTLNIGSAATSISIGSGSSTITVGNDLTATGNVTAPNFIGNATTADKWATARTITLGGDLTGNVSIDGSANVTLTATIAADSVALGTDTTGDYVASVGAGTSSTQTGSSGLTIVGTGEGATVTIAHADTSSATSLTASSRTYVTALTFDTYGHVTAYSTAAETVTDTNTTYSQSAVTTTGGALLRLTGSDASTDDVKFASGTNVTVAYTDANTITISSANDTNTTYTQSAVTTTGGALLRLTGSDASTDDVKFASGTNVTVAYTDANTITISANDTSVALGTETTGNYVASITNGSYITGGDGGSAGAALTLAVDAASANTVSKVVARDSSGNFAAGTITAALSGNATTATTLATARTIAISGDVTGSATSFNGSADITISAGITSDSIVNADINSAAGIVDTKLATIATAGKVSNSATTATALNTNSAIVARDLSGNFAAGTITAALSGNATTATTWANSRTITLGGDLSGSVSIDGSANVTLTATIAADSVALGTDTTGNYVATVSAGTPGVETSSSGLTISATAGEGTAATIAHADTSTITGAQGTAGIAAITIDGFGHVTAVTTATYLTSQSSDFATVTVTDTDTGYTWASTGSAAADTTADTITFVDGGGIDIDVDATSDAIRIQHTDTSTVSNLSATSRTYVSALTFDTYGHVTAYSTAAETVVDTNTTSLPIENSAGTSQFTATDSTGLQFAASGIASVAFDAVNYRVTVSATEADTLDSVTGRGATTANSITVGDIAVNGGDITTNQTTFGLVDTTATTVNAFGATTTLNLGYDSTAASTTNISIGATATSTTKTINLGTGGASGSTTTINIGSASGGTTTVNNNLTVTGNLTVNGTTTTVNSTTVTIDDPIFTIGGDTAPASDDNKDRGIEFRWHNGTSAKVGYFGYDDSTGYFTFIPDATNTSEVFSGTLGTLDVASITGSAATLTTTRTIWGQNFNGSANVTGNLTSVGNITGSGAVTLASAAGSALVLNSGTTGAITLDSGTTGDVNVGTGASAKTVTIGNITGATATVIQSGSGKVKFNIGAVSLFLPTADGTNGQVLKTDGAGNLSFASVDSLSGGISNVVEDTTPQLGGNLDVNGNSIVSVSNGNILITPDGTGYIQLDGLKWPTADGSNGYLLQTNGAGQLAWTAAGSNTTYTQSAVTTTGGALLRLTGSDASTDDVKFADGNSITVAYTDANTITINHADTSTITGAQGTAGIAAITIDGFGHVTAVTTATYLTAESDTLATVTGRGATTSTASSFTGGAVVALEDAGTNTVLYPLDVRRTSSSTPAAGIGVGMEFIVETTAGNNETGAMIEAVTTDITATSEDFDLVFRTMAAGVAPDKRLTLTSAGALQLWNSASTFYHSVTSPATANRTITLPDGNVTLQAGTMALTGSTLAQFAATTSSQLAGVISDETGSGALTFATSPTFTTSILAASATMGLFDTTATTVDAFGATTTLNLGYDSTAASTTNISVGAVAAATTKTINLGTGGAASSITNVNIGASPGGTTTISSPNITISSLADTATTATHYYVETTGGNILPKTLANVKTEIVTTAAVNSAAATTVGTITSGTWNGGVISATYGGTGVSSLGTGVATWLGTPSSANLASAITDETGSGALVFGTAPTFTTTIDGGATFGAFASSTALTLGYTGTAASTINISTGATATTVTKTVNLGTGGAAGSTTNINIGSSVAGTTTISSPNITISSLADTATTATHYYVETTGGNILPKTLANVKTEIVTTAAVNAAAATTVGTITSGTWSGSFGAVSGANLTSLTAGNLSGTIPSAVLGNSTVYVGTTAIALNRTTASQSLTGVSIDGSAGSATNATNAAWLRQTDGTGLLTPAQAITTSGARGTDLAPNTYGQGIFSEFKNSSLYSSTGTYSGLLTYANWVGTTASTGDPSYQLLFSPASANSTSAPTLKIRAGIDTTWGAWSTLLHSSNYNTYAPTLTGTGASGSWGISITGSSASTTGNAATVTNGVYTTGNQSIAGIKTFTNGTASTTNATGSVVITGGLGVSGAINAGADVTAYAASDNRLKTNIENIPDALAKVNQLNGVTYNWNELAHEVEHKDTTVREVGVIAQQVNDVLPEVINVRDNGYMAVRYEKMVPLLIEAIKELTEHNRQLAQRLSDLEDKNER